MRKLRRGSYKSYYYVNHLNLSAYDKMFLNIFLKYCNKELVWKEHGKKIMWYMGCAPRTLYNVLERLEKKRFLRVAHIVYDEEREKTMLLLRLDPDRRYKFYQLKNNISSERPENRKEGY